MKMNTYIGKRVLSLVRGGDYAHAGEEVAIERTLSSVEKKPDQVLLDVGCGMGGTADYVCKNGWGSVVGIDVNAEMIAYAQKTYQGSSFHVCDVVNASQVIKEPVDVIYMLNSFYLFPDQPAALTVLWDIAKRGSLLVIFDYVDRGGYRSNPPPKEYDEIHYPLELSAISKMLEDCGWLLNTIEEIHDEYQHWYTNLIERVENKREEIISLSGEDRYVYVHTFYTHILSSIRSGTLGGAIVRAHRA